jgi:hypothetical protein
MSFKVIVMTLSAEADLVCVASHPVAAHTLAGRYVISGRTATVNGDPAVWIPLYNLPVGTICFGTVRVRFTAVVVAMTVLLFKRVRRSRAISDVVAPPRTPLRRT